VTDCSKITRQFFACLSWWRVFQPLYIPTSCRQGEVPTLHYKYSQIPAARLLPAFHTMKIVDCGHSICKWKLGSQPKAPILRMNVRLVAAVAAPFPSCGCLLRLMSPSRFSPTQQQFNEKTFTRSLGCVVTRTNNRAQGSQSGFGQRWSTGFSHGESCWRHYGQCATH